MPPLLVFVIFPFILGNALCSVDLACPLLTLPYGKVHYRDEGKLVAFSCNPGFRMNGAASSRCGEGVWDNETPICYSNEPGCPPYAREIPNTHVFRSPGIVVIQCKRGFELNGSRIIFCNGTKWNTTITPNCYVKSRLSSSTTTPPDVISIIPNLSLLAINSDKINCSFEEPCAWIQGHEPKYRWSIHNGSTSRGVPDIGGPTHDATFASSGASGHYMYARPTSVSANADDTAQLISPIFPASSTNSCLTFSYYLHGLRSRTLLVYVVVYTTENHLNEIQRITGDHGDRWHVSDTEIPSQNAPFRIIFEVARGTNFAGDVAIDEIIYTPHSCTKNTSVLPDMEQGDKDELLKVGVFPIRDAELDSDLTYEETKNPTRNLPEVNIDVYELGNRSLVDEPSEFAIQVINNHSVTINPFNWTQSVKGNSVASPPTSSEGSRVLVDEKRVANNGLMVYVGVAVAGSILVTVIMGAVTFVLWKRRKHSQQKAPTHEEAEFQYFSYANEGFHEIATLPVDKMAKK